MAIAAKRASIVNGDCETVLAQLEDNSVDAVLTDSPYELGFMGKRWDATGISYSVEMWREVLRVLKPGGHLLAFGGTRTYHRLTCAIEDAGFEIRDCVMWIFGTGFPKSLNVSKAIDDAAGATREAAGIRTSFRPKSNAQRDPDGFQDRSNGAISIPATPEARQWNGWGTALKPAHEPIVLARKPLEGTVATNVRKWGTGALNIDGSRIQGADKLGRWPANVLLDEAAADEVDAQSGTLKSGAVKPHHVRTTSKTKNTFGERAANREPPRESSEGGASRFFYVAKPTRKERDNGCDDLDSVSGGAATGRTDGSAGVGNPRAGAGRTGGAKNFHPTVKPVELLRYLARMIVPPDGLVLDPFAGSGSVGVACLLEGFRFLGIELNPDYVEIAQPRLRLARREPKRW